MQYTVDMTVERVDGVFNVASVLIMIIVQHRSLHQMDKVVQLFRETNDDSSPFSLRALMGHHAFIVAASLVAPAFMAAGIVVAHGASMACMDTISLLVTVPILSVYFNTVIAVPELIFVCCVDSLANQVGKSVKEYKNSDKKVEDLSRLFKKQKRHFEILKATEEAFGSVAFVLIGVSVVMLTSNTYLSVANMANMVWGVPAASYVTGAGQVVSILVPLKRMLHLSNHAQALSDAFQEVVETAVLQPPTSSDPNAPHNFGDAERTRVLLERIDGINVMGLFSLNRGVLLASLSQILTYLIILIEFKMDDSS